MDLSSTQLAAFRSLAATRSFTASAKALGLTQSALSQRIKNLEDELGTALVVRDRLGARLTDAGERLLQYCQAKGALEEELIQELTRPGHSGELHGTVRVGGYSTLIRSVVLPALSPLSRNAGVVIHAQTREMADLPELLRSGEADWVFTDRPIDRSGVKSIQVGIERYVLVENKAYSGPDLYLDMSESDETTLRYLKLLGLKKPAFQRRFLNDIYAILDAVKAGWGRAVLPLHLVCDEKQLHVLHPRTVLEEPVFLNYFTQPYFTRLQQETQKVLESACKEALK